MLCLLLLPYACAPPSAVRDDPEDVPLRDPDEVDELNLRLDLAAQLLRSGNSAAVQPLLQRVLRENPDSGLAHYYLGIVLEEREQPEPAEREYRAAVRYEPKLDTAMSRLGVLLAERGRMKEAVQWLEKAVATRPRQASHHSNLGYALFVAGRPEEAIAAYKQATTLDPAARVTYNNIGFTYGKLGRFDEARQAFEQAGDASAVQTNMGLVFELRGRRAEAEAAYTEALRIRPGSAVARHNLEALRAGRAAPSDPVGPVPEAPVEPAVEPAAEPAAEPTSEQGEP